MIREPDSMVTSELVITALDEYHRRSSSTYDEVLQQVSDRAAKTGDIGKLEIAALTGWKRLNASTPWMSALMSTPDADVRAVTRDTVGKATDSTVSTPEAAAAARNTLYALPGFRHGDALASAVILAAAPFRMAVYDRRAHAGLMRLGYPLRRGRGCYGRYIELIEQIRQECRSAGKVLAARDVDLAMYWLGR